MVWWPEMACWLRWRRLQREERRAGRLLVRETEHWLAASGVTGRPRLP